MIKNSVAYVTETDTFDSGNPRQRILREADDIFTATYPSQVYLAVVADQSG